MIYSDIFRMNGCNMGNLEEIYIIKRRIKAFFHSLVYYACHIFPVQKNKIVMWTFEGSGGYACSPKYIAEEIFRRNSLHQSDFEIYWLTSNMDKKFPDGVKVVKDSLWNRAYHLSTAKFWVANTRSFWGTVKRKGSYYIQTWHGSVSLKPIGRCRGSKLSKIAYLVSKADSDLMDYAISGSKWCTDMWPDGLIYDGRILDFGTPRCDVFLGDREACRRNMRKEYALPAYAKICLYAPTFRGGSQSTKRSVNAEPISLQLERVLQAMEKRFGGQWYVFLRLHPQLAAKMEKLPVQEESDRYIDVSQRDDMAEIMASTDAIITDYSTIIFEGFLTGQPGFIYADDLEEYVRDRGKLMFEMDEIPFPAATTNDRLEENILSFDMEKYQHEVELFKHKVGIFEDGNASKRVVDLMCNLE